MKIGMRYYNEEKYADWTKTNKVEWDRKRIKMVDLKTVFGKNTRTYRYESDLGRVDLSAEDYRKKLLSAVCSIGEGKLDAIKEFLEGYKEGTLLSVYNARDEGISSWSAEWLAVANETKTMYDRRARLRGIASTYQAEQFLLDVNEIPKALELIDEAKGKMGSYEDGKAYEKSLRDLESAYDRLKEEAKRDGWYDMTVMEIREHIERDIRNAVFYGANNSSSFRTFSTEPYTYLLVDDGGQARIKTHAEYLRKNRLTTDFHPRINKELIARYEEMHRAKYDRRHNYAQRWLKACDSLITFLTI